MQFIVACAIAPCGGALRSQQGVTHGTGAAQAMQQTKNSSQKERRGCATTLFVPGFKFALRRASDVLAAG